MIRRLLFILVVSTVPANFIAAAAHADEVAIQPVTSAARSPEPPPLPPIDIRDLPPPSTGLGELIGPLLKTLLMLGVVVAIAYLTLHKGLGKLVERQNAGKRVKVVERIALDPKRSLFLIEIDGKQMLLAGGEGGVVHIKDIEKAAGAAPEAPVTTQPFRFADVLKKSGKA